MRSLLTLVAAIALPLSAIAQPAVDIGKSTEVSELVVQARKATAVSGLMVKGGCPVPQDVGERDMNGRQFDAPSDTKGKRTEESPGTRAFILREIADFRSGTPDYAHMGGLMARVTRESLPLLERWVVCRGAFYDIRFLHVSQRGYDDFEVDFSNGAIEWEVEPLDPHDVVEQAALRFFYPQPVTKQFDDLLKSMERGSPHYVDLTPDFASTLRAQWPTMQPVFKTWRGSRSIYFLRKEDDGSYTFKVVYGNHPVVWKVAPLDGAGKITGLEFDDAA